MTEWLSGAVARALKILQYLVPQGLTVTGVMLAEAGEAQIGCVDGSEGQATVHVGFKLVTVP